MVVNGCQNVANGGVVSSSEEIREPATLGMSSFDRMLGWFPNTRREWIELIIVTVLLWLLMVAITELELLSVG